LSHFHDVITMVDSIWKTFDLASMSKLSLGTAWRNANIWNWRVCSVMFNVSTWWKFVVGFTLQPPYPFERAYSSDWTEGRRGLTTGLDVSDKTLLFLPGGDNRFSVIQLVSRINGAIPLLQLEDLSEIKFTHYACRTAVRTYVYKSVWRRLKVCCGLSCSVCERSKACD
jgi:hypothetical protein